ncbi:MAG TPA: cytochrome c [Candidatus Binataceae bacterium]|nr:cytochrome c [Candidatus Binataceae bacterium]
MPKKVFENASHKPHAANAARRCATGAIAVAAILAIAIGSARAAQPAGQADYQQYCSDCHGKDARGNGPLVKQIPMAPPPSDLTLLASARGGKFPFDDVVDVIDGRKAIPSHARIQMPFWGVTLQKPGQEFSPASDAAVKQRIQAIARYLEGLQR